MKRRFLVIQLRQLGDILLTTPVLMSLKQRVPGCHITFLCHRMGLPLLGGHPWVDAVWTYDEGLRWREQVRLLRRLRSHEFEAVFDFMANPRSLLAALWARSQRRYSIASRRARFYTEALPKGSRVGFIGDEKQAVVDLYLGPPPPGWRHPPPFFAIPLPSYRVWGSWPGGGGRQEGGRWVYLAPTHRRQVRRWPLERYSALAAELFSRYRLRSVVGWGPGEQDVARAVVAPLSPGQAVVLPPTSLQEVAACIAQSCLFVGNSNGPSHFAYAVGTPSVQIHGPTQLSAWSRGGAYHAGVQGARGDIAAVSLADVLAQCELLLRRTGVI